MQRFTIYLLAFGGYTLALLLLTGQTFGWNETRKTFYLGGRRTGFVMSLATFCATWISAASLVGFTVWMIADGYVAFSGSVFGWLFGLTPLPFLVYRLRRSKAISLPQWVADEYGDKRLRRFCGGAMIFAYSFYLVIQFRTFGEVASHMLHIPHGLYAAALVYLFVLYTTFGGYPAVVRSDALNLLLAIAGATLAAVSAAWVYGSPIGAHIRLARSAPELLRSWGSAGDIPVVLSLSLAWGLGVSCNPQYAVRVMAARTARDARRMLAAAPFVLGWFYFCLVCLGAVCMAYSSLPRGEVISFPVYFENALPMWGSLPLLVAVLASAVSTANSQLLLAACSLCHDIIMPERGSADPFGEDAFLFGNRLAIVGIASFSLVISQLVDLPGILAIGRISWSIIAICFLFPLYLPSRAARRVKNGRGVYPLLLCSLAAHVFLALRTPLSWEMSMLAVLCAQGLGWLLLLRAEGEGSA